VCPAASAAKPMPFWTSVVAPGCDPWWNTGSVPITITLPVIAGLQVETFASAAANASVPPQAGSPITIVLYAAKSLALFAAQSDALASSTVRPRLSASTCSRLPLPPTTLVSRMSTSAPPFVRPTAFEGRSASAPMGDERGQTDRAAHEPPYGPALPPRPGYDGFRRPPRPLGRDTSVSARGVRPRRKFPLTAESS
jgi:hypothetical protein